MKYSDSLANIAPALVKAQTAMKSIAKDSKNPAFNSSFASLDTIIESTRPTLTANGLALVQGATTPVTDADGHLCGFAVETMLIHTSGEYVMNAAVMPLDKMNAQGAGSALTYGRRYGISALLSLSTDEDDDGNRASAPRATNTVTARPISAPIPQRGEQASGRDDIGATARPTDDPECPSCGGGMWDNRVGKKNPRSPDFKCKKAPKERGGPGCEGVIWPPKDAPVLEEIPF